MKRRNTIFTTSEYIDALILKPEESRYESKGADFGFFNSKAAADDDAQWLADYCAKEGKKVRKPTVYRIRFEKV